MFVLYRSRIMPEMVVANTLVILSGWIADKIRLLDEFKLRPRDQIALELTGWNVAELEALVDCGPSTASEDSLLGHDRSVLEALRKAKSPLLPSIETRAPNGNTNVS